MGEPHTVNQAKEEIIMKQLRGAVAILLTALVLCAIPAAFAPGVAGAAGIPVRRSGTGYCLNAPITFANVVIAGGQCYNFYLVRSAAGSFLGVGPGGSPLVAQGDRLQYGDGVRARFRYLLPLGIGLTNIPQNSVALAAVQFLLQGSQLVLSVPLGEGRVHYLRSGGLPQER
jgi:hypothetical protein